MKKERIIVNNTNNMNILGAFFGYLQKDKYNTTNDVGAGSVSAQKGITLIALVITIIILLILASVVINLTIRRKWFI